MKKVIILFIFLVLLSSPALSQSGWFMQPTPTTSILYSSSFPSGDTGYACTSSGGILKTTNGGVIWFMQNPGISTLYHHIYFINNTTGWAVGHNGITLRTSDGGINWLNSITPNPQNLFYVRFNNSLTGYCSGDFGVYKSTNGGASWNVSLVEPWVYSVYFTSINTGWAGVRFGKMFKTTNGGANWVQQSTPTMATAFGMHFIDNNTGYAVGDYNSILKTTNGGSSWFFQQYSQGNINTTFRSVNFIRPATGYIAGFNGLLLKTTNSGNNWNRIMLNTNSNFYSVRSYRNEGWLTGDNGTIMHNSALVSIENYSEAIPEVYSLYQNFPNPFNPSTKIKFDIPENSLGQGSLAITNSLGQTISQELFQLNSGKYEVEFNGSQLPSGIYFYTLKTPGFTSSKKMILSK